MGNALVSSETKESYSHTHDGKVILTIHGTKLGGLARQ
jgi:hypothetical protein